MLRPRLLSARPALILLGAFVGQVCAWSQTPPAPGTMVATVGVPAAARCASTIGTSLTIVPGSLINLPQYPILVVLSCYGPAAGQGSQLYFLDARTSPATLVRTITTTTTPPLGWGALALRGNRGDLAGCGNENGGTHAVYSINISPYDTVADGTATFLFNAQAGQVICDGLTYDTADRTFYQGPDVASTVYHFSETGTPLGSFSVPAGCPKSGVAVGGASLFIACNGVTTIHQVNKSTGALFRTFPSGGTRTEDLECDPLSFSSQRTDVIWSKDAFSNDFFAFAIPPGTCGVGGGPPVNPAACADGSVTDTDGDALLDCWERDGIDWDGDGTIDYRLPGANVRHKDVYLEIDYMELHRPNPDAVADVIAAFAAAPVTNPDGVNGVTLHVEVGEQAMAHNNNTAFTPCTAPASGGAADFDTVKQGFFGSAAERANLKTLNAKRFGFRYLLYVHNLLGLGGTSGCAELPGNDYVVSLGSWTPVPAVGGHPVGTRDQQAGTIMHEIGHNLNLRHGGGDNNNCKPNYLSVMSYTRQINNSPILGRPLDYSPQLLAALNEGALSELAGIGGPAGSQTAYGPDPVMVAAGNGPIDWNRDGVATNPSVAANVNLLAGSGCNGSGTVLAGYNDWSNVQFNFRTSTDFADGVHLTVLESDEITFAEAENLSPDSDLDGIKNISDNCPLTPNAGQSDSNADSLGDACPLPAVPGDVNRDGVVNCSDVSIVRGAFRLRVGQNGYDSRADLNGDGVIDIRDLNAVTRRLAPGTVCQQ